MKKLLVSVIAGLVLFACGQMKQDQDQTEVQVIEINELLSNPLDFDEKEVSIHGIISHVCRHSGDKMRVAEIEGDGLSVLVMLMDYSEVFGPESEGQELIVSGTLKTWIRNIDELEDDHDHGDGHDHEEGHACESTEEAIKLMKEKGIDPDIAAYIELVSYQLK
ncbi:MAG: hypothetical protein EOM23_07185 [Candidatus Moranbacteria bacterium]|nr:hypothetical protein [Candidatus Moranbacteria bacterium]